ncbi:hypothetical protein K466DRAFT_649605 [Polyporus arcularius HHB13444]|uniref:C2 domain-containing protein n=1 Tax=Polyporus arcularius HHB13444 TaxID=1314778 RepID=A0A5C3PWV8_9APHY|nr:hypothetical protein K466DRAFT_649605 [Polyporus arcularius HHB13444]
MSTGREIGTLVVVVLKARNLRDKHTIHKQDVFAQATLNKTTKKTKTDVRGGQHPVWDEELRFPIFNPASDETRKLEVACYSKEPRSDDFIGRGTVDISETLKTGEFDDWVPLQMEDGQYRGDVFLEMTFYSAAPPPQRRPSKWEPKDRLKRPESAYAYPTSSPQATSAPNGRTGHSPGAHKNDPLPPLPEESGPPATIPAILRPGGGAPSRTSPKAGGGLLPPEHPAHTHAPYTAPRDPSPPAPVRHSLSDTPLDSIPAHLRPGGGAPRPSAHAQPGPAAAPPHIPDPYIPTPEIPAYSTPARPQTYYDAGEYAPPQPRPYPQYTAPAPRPRSYGEYEPPSRGSWYGAPPVPEPQSQPYPPYGGYPSTSGYGREQNLDLPDPYLLARYKTPLPLPNDSRTQSQPQSQPTPKPQTQTQPPPKHPQAASPQAQPAPKPKGPSREERDRQIALELEKEEEERQRKAREQEERDLELARQLDMELNLDGNGEASSGSEVRTAAGAPGMPGGL